MSEDKGAIQTPLKPNGEALPPPQKSNISKKLSRRKRSVRAAKAAVKNQKPRVRSVRPYPAGPFEETLELALAIQKFAAGERVRRLTLLRQMEKSPSSSTTKQLITNSGKYGLTVGSYSAEYLAMTELGRAATSEVDPRTKLSAQFKLAIENIMPFNTLYESYKNKKLPTRDVLRDALAEADVPSDLLGECVDTFLVNAKFLGLMQTIAGSEMVVPIEQVLEELQGTKMPILSPVPRVPKKSGAAASSSDGASQIHWTKVCFYISPIGEEGSLERKHADLFLSSLVEPALAELGLVVVRADKISSGGLITAQVIEHIMRAGLVVVDLSFHNPNAFYEMALRHATKRPVIQISRKEDELPFDVGQVRTVVIDTTDIYALVPKLETYKAEIATHARAAMSDPESGVGNPLTAFFPGFEVSIPKEK